jgi:hypothetical protein
VDDIGNFGRTPGRAQSANHILSTRAFYPLQIQALVDDIGACAAAELEAAMVAEADAATRHILASLGDDPAAKLVCRTLHWVHWDYHWSVSSRI